ncbi:DUF3788 domain-containing protein [Lachnospiraceae bacterium OttesenSCG-928-J05]|nr:DUF3788 domain-containing protein [Lachnospiraceae bacterium OttesenSCG-928-J05]
MKKPIPTQNELLSLLGKERFAAWNAVCSAVDSLYEMDTLWNDGGKKWDYEYKYRRGGKTLCALYAREQCFGVLIIFGKDERAKFEASRNEYSETVQSIYDEATTFHDGKWVMFEMEDSSLLDEVIKLLAIKRKSKKVIDKSS